ncbi:pyridoxamine 5'-phosphate oxidase family protein [Streptacidiphilus griseoplanus]|uniref:pyridoxamine 5'-phosphate oxidase family protein n=1 Tax=Peterkaempfera griseoplana TaxID=66896 RepID=UPI0006E2A871|nr:pyridoxamine 5'-phosphate oxidase family protein [Peterkaempfera griseoplana]
METPETPFHPGETAVQRRAGVLDQAGHVGRSVRAVIPPVAAHFLAERRMLVVGAADARGRIWATLLTGHPGFLGTPDEGTLSVAARPVPGDPLGEVLSGPAKVGTIALEPAGRRRMRLNGRSRPHAGGLLISADQVYSNCPKYIQRRRVLDSPAPAAPPAPPRWSTVLDTGQSLRIATADTFFIASADARGDTDASHRGGNPGFVEVVAPDRLRWPEYPGNNMFMTLGNLEERPQAGLLFPDWETGTALLLTGTARVGWAAGAPAVDFTVGAVAELPAAGGLRWSAPEFSPANPPVAPTGRR